MGVPSPRLLLDTKKRARGADYDSGNGTLSRGTEERDDASRVNAAVFPDTIDCATPDSSTHKRHVCSNTSARGNNGDKRYNTAQCHIIYICRLYFGEVDMARICYNIIYTTYRTHLIGHIENECKVVRVLKVRTEMNYRAQAVCIVFD
jgi:hypothetical protein